MSQKNTKRPRTAGGENSAEEHCPRHMQNSTFITQTLAKPEPAHTWGLPRGERRRTTSGLAGIQAQEYTFFCYETHHSTFSFLQNHRNERAFAITCFSVQKKPIQKNPFQK